MKKIEARQKSEWLSKRGYFPVANYAPRGWDGRNDETITIYINPQKCMLSAATNGCPEMGVDMKLIKQNFYCID